VKLTLEGAVDFSKSNALSMKHHMDNEHEDFDLNPMITMYSKDVDAPLFQIILPTVAMHEENKRLAYMVATSVASFIDADYLTMVNDVFMAKHDKSEDTKEEEIIAKAVRPSEDPNSVEALLIVGMSKEKGMVVTQEYGRDDIGKMYYKDTMTDSFDYKSLDDESLDRSWMTRIGAMALMNTGLDVVGVGAEDYDLKLNLLYQAMENMDNLDFMVAYTNVFGDYVSEKMYSDDLSKQSKKMIEIFQSGRQDMWGLEDE
tara:strand:- start:2726 stop:3499 length:774 start_codon:yes stop_codon:yes gene_type:complete